MFEISRNKANPVKASYRGHHRNRTGKSRTQIQKLYKNSQKHRNRSLKMARNKTKAFVKLL